MVNPYKIQGPAVISFSGGRTSAYMLRHCLDAGLDADVHVMFCNTGKERPETLDFVNECSVRWGVNIRWLEYERKYLPKYRSRERERAAAQTRLVAGVQLDDRPDGETERGFRDVTYETASRNGEPFNNVIQINGLPNQNTRLCTQEMKIRIIKKAMLELGYKDGWSNVVGIRADEPHRVARLRANTRELWDNVLPLADAGVTEQNVMEFWSKQTFDLQLNSYQGNCDLCFLKSTNKKLRVIRERPDLADWWINHERNTGQTFRAGETYARLRDRALENTGLFAIFQVCSVQKSEDDDDLGDCVCHD